ncbi:MAG: L-threonylcarbamoyladenylate synthase [Magnetococcales bacterium]|nr:L-threonylcarbamoyladenylate synthase [Magnetococcales bacterium]
MSRAAVDALCRGEVIALATETLFGLSIDPDHPGAMARLLAMKGRPPAKGLILLVPDLERLEPLILPPSPVARDLMERFWPGPLTLALPARSHLAACLTGGTGFIAARVSSAPQVMALMALWQRPLVSTSANRSGQPTPTRAEDVRALWPEEELLVIDGPIRPDGLPSTLLRVEGERVTLLRAGAIPTEALRVPLA